MQKDERSLKSRKRVNYLSLWLCFVTVVLLVASVTSVASKGPHAVANDQHEANKVSLAVSDARPVAFAAKALEKTYGWIITYEDPPYVNQSDLVDVTDTVRRDRDKFKPGEAPKVFAPKGGSLAFEYDVDEATNKPANASGVVQQMLDAYANSGHPGIFHKETDPERVHIIAGAVKNEDGIVVSRQSVFDASVTIAPQKRNALQLLEAFCTAVTESSGTRVRLATAPLNLLQSYQTEIGAKDQKARDFLTHELDRMTGRASLSWQLLYDPSSKAYFLNIYPV